ncbi:MAG TPA: FxSxx-COOH cyclophane-containing RiPP peptide [Actinocrinis sp.]
MSETASGMPDLRSVPLAELAAADLRALRRIVPSPSRPRVPVAAFQSDI